MGSNCRLFETSWGFLFFGLAAAENQTACVEFENVLTIFDRIETPDMGHFISIKASKVSGLRKKIVHFEFRSKKLVGSRNFDSALLDLRPCSLHFVLVKYHQ